MKGCFMQGHHIVCLLDENGNPLSWHSVANQAEGIVTGTKARMYGRCCSYAVLFVCSNSGGDHFPGRPTGRFADGHPYEGGHHSGCHPPP